MMNVYELIESCHTRQELDAIRLDLIYVMDSCESVEECNRIQAAFRKQKNRIQNGLYKKEEY